MKNHWLIEIRQDEDSETFSGSVHKLEEPISEQIEQIVFAKTFKAGYGGELEIEKIIEFAQNFILGEMKNNGGK